MSDDSDIQIISDSGSDDGEDIFENQGFGQETNTLAKQLESRFIVSFEAIECINSTPF